MPTITQRKRESTVTGFDGGLDIEKTSNGELQNSGPSSIIQP